MSSLTNNTAKQQDTCRAQEMLRTQTQRFWAGDFFSGVPLTWPCALGTHTTRVFSSIVSPAGSPQLSELLALWSEGREWNSLQNLRKGDGGEVPSFLRWLIPSHTVTPLLSWDLSFTFPAGWDLEHSFATWEMLSEFTGLMCELSSSGVLFCGDCRRKRQRKWYLFFIYPKIKL